VPVFRGVVVNTDWAQFLAQLRFSVHGDDLPLAV